MDNDKIIDIGLNSDYWDMLEATARLVDTWPNWKTGEYTTATGDDRGVAQASTTPAQASSRNDQKYCW